MKMLQVTVEFRVFGKSRADVGSRNVYLRAYRKDLKLISKGEQLPGQMVVIL